MQHARQGLGGSSAHRTLNCPGWRHLLPEEPAVEGKPSIHMAEGTVLHEAMACRMNGEPIPFGLEYADATLDAALWERGKAALELYHALLAELKFEVEDMWVEQRVSLPGFDNEAFGTVDLLSRSKDDRWLVLDWKFGEGVRVEDWDQNLFYASGARIPNGPIYLVTIQPAFGTRVMECTPKDLEVWHARYRLAVANDWFQLGDHCRWCPCKAACPEMNPQELPENLSEALERARYLEQWIADVRKRARGALMDGHKVEGWKLVQTLGKREWKDDPYPVFGDDVLDRRVRSPAQMEKLGHDVDGLTHRVLGSPVLARADDKRPAYMAGIINAIRKMT